MISGKLHRLALLEMKNYANDQRRALHCKILGKIILNFLHSSATEDVFFALETLETSCVIVLRKILTVQSQQKTATNYR